jgi:nicotinate phosphoribosyltransferase
MSPIITSLLDTDLYKFTMWQAFLHRHPNTQSEYAFVCRNTTAFPLTELIDDIEREIAHLCQLRFQEDELTYLRSLPFIQSDFVDFLHLFQFQRRFLEIRCEGATLIIHAKGPQIHVMGFEIPVLAIVNELYFRRFDQAACLAEGRRRLDAKIELLQQFQHEPALRHPFEFFDFGTRRRYSGEWQREVVSRFATDAKPWCKGSSNVMLAKQLGITPVGTMAHEYLQSYQACGVHLRQFQKAALDDWAQEYRGMLAIALTDVVGMDAFLADFDLYFAKIYDGLRHDSGDPTIWGEKALAHYAKLGIDAQNKRLIFSDGLDFHLAHQLYRHFAGRIMTGFGIGTHLTNDVGVKALNIVMKLISCNGQPVAKLSDSPGKTLCQDQVFLAYLAQIFQHPAL